MVNEKALDKAVSRYVQPVRICKHLGVNHPNAIAVIWHCMPIIIAEYRRIIAKELV